METVNKEKWTIDNTHSDISFKIKHLMITNVTGVFRHFDASIYTTSDDFKTAEVDLVIDAASIDTGIADRDNHVRSEDFFDTSAHPQIRFISSGIEEIDKDGSYDLWGELTIKGISKKIKLSVEFGGVVKDPWGNEKAGFSIHGTVNRKDFGLHWNAPLETGGFLVSDIVYINCEIQLKRSA